MKKFTDLTGFGKIPRLKLIIRVMKLTGLFIALSVVTVLAGNSYSQTKLLNLNAEKATVKQVLSIIEDQSEFYFMYSGKIIDVEREVTVNVKNKKIDEVLNSLFEGTNVEYVIKDKFIVLTDSKKGNDVIDVFQQKTVSGKVTDASGLPLPGVTVVLKGTTQGTITDSGGNYTITDVNEKTTLVFSFVGMKTMEIPTGNQAVINVTMVADAIGIEEVVAIGYGTIRRKDLTGAVSQVKSDEIQKIASAGLDQAMQGKVAGVQVMVNQGDPGGSVSMRIRGIGSINGSSEPLYVVDGIPLNNINSINTADVESIDVLKDASSAAIYGARASNGVVLITTKRAKSNKLMVNFDAYTGMQQAAKQLDVCNSFQFLTLANEAYQNTLNDPRYSGQKPPPPNPLWSNPSSFETYDWQNAILQNSPIQSYNVSVAGGNEKIKALISGGYYAQDGIVLGSDYNRYTFRVNTDYVVNKKLKFGSNINVNRELTHSVSTKATTEGVLIVAFQQHPQLPIYSDVEGPNGDYYFGYKGYNNYNWRKTSNLYIPGQMRNPLLLAELQGMNEVMTMGFDGSVFGEYEILKGLKYRSIMNASGGTVNQEYPQPSLPEEIGSGFSSIANLTKNLNIHYQWNFVNTINYDLTLNKNQLNVMMGTDALRIRRDFINVSAREFPNNDAISVSSAAKLTAFGAPYDAALISYFGRVNYTFSDKYLLTLNVRRDGSSKFGPDRKWGTFPSAAIAWRLSEESFMKGISWMDNFKIRASYGVLGNQNIDNFLYLNTYNSIDPDNSAGSNPLAYTLGTSQSKVIGTDAKNIANPSIHWEESRQTDIGLDLFILNGKLSIVADYYKKDLVDLLGYEVVPSSFGAPKNQRFYNFASMQNSGVELSVNYNEKIGDLKFSITSNFTSQKNEVTNIGKSDELITSFNISGSGAAARTVVGEPIGYFYGYLTDGIFQNQSEIANGPTQPSSVVPGDRRFKDISGPDGVPDGKVDGKDRTNLGSGIPKYMFGTNLEASYKNFDFSVFLQGVAGVKILNNNLRFLHNIRNFNGTGVQNVLADVYKERWHGEGTSNTMPRVAYIPSGNNFLFSDAYIEDGSFLRIRNLQIGYSIPNSIVSNWGISKIRLYLSGQNLFTFTKYSGYDPEVGSLGLLGNGVDQGRYPVARSYMIGVNVTL